jgi:hypothetical protein
MGTTVAVSGMTLKHAGNRETVIGARWGIECSLDRGLPADGYGETPRAAMGAAVLALLADGDIPLAVRAAVESADIAVPHIPAHDCARIAGSATYRYGARIELSDWHLRYAR